MELFKASNQWSQRPADERFWTLEEMIAACRHYREIAVEASVPYRDLRVEADGGDVRLVGKKGIPAKLTHWSFGQICQRASAPAGYLRDLPATLAVQNINHGLAKLGKAEGDEAAKLMFHRNGEMLLRCAMTPTYSRIWNHEILERLARALPKGWQVPPARPAGIDGERVRVATDADVLRLKKGGLSINVGDKIAPAGLYASDHDCFVFMVNEDAAIDDGNGHGLGRGFFLWNSEVGASSFGVTTFLYDAVCGNHIVWGARDVAELRVRHVGKADDKAFRGLSAELVRYADESASDMEAQIVAARRFELGATKDEVIDAVLGLAAKKKIQGLTRTVVDESYDLAAASPRYGSPRAIWGMVNGITEASQKTAHADARVKLDRAAGKLLEVVEF